MGENTSPWRGLKVNSNVTTGDKENSDLEYMRKEEKTSAYSVLR